MAAKPTTFDEYLAGLSEENRTALQKLRKMIRAAVPKAEECISYGLAAFRLNGRPLVALGATANHCAFYPMSSSTVSALKDDLEGYDTSKGTIRFPANRPLPVALVRKLVRARLAENEGRQAGASKPPRSSKRRDPGPQGSSQTDPAVEAFLRELDHPLKQQVEAIRQIILGVSPEIREGIKWNSPSFRTTEYFATINVRDRDRIRLILHLGAKAKDNSTKKRPIPDPEGLLEWLATDRCLVTICDGEDIMARRAALEAIVGAWIQLP